MSLCASENEKLIPETQVGLTLGRVSSVPVRGTIRSVANGLMTCPRTHAATFQFWRCTYVGNTGIASIETESCCLITSRCLSKVQQTLEDRMPILVQGRQSWGLGVATVQILGRWSWGHRGSWRGLWKYNSLFRSLTSEAWPPHGHRKISLLCLSFQCSKPWRHPYLDSTLTFSEHVANLTRSSYVMLYGYL